MSLKENNQWHSCCIYIYMRHIILLLFFTSSLVAQGNLGVNFGLNDDNFGKIENHHNVV